MLIMVKVSLNLILRLILLKILYMLSLIMYMINIIYVHIWCAWITDSH